MVGDNMILKVRKSNMTGTVNVPGSKSHTIRALFFASLAEGSSTIRNPLVSSDALSAQSVCKSFGSDILFSNNVYTVSGVAGRPSVPENIIDVGNSGTSLRLALMTAALTEGYTVLTGDYQIRRRQIGPLVSAINNLGAEAYTTRGNGSAPVVVKGRAKGGFTDLDAVTSQYLSSLLMHAPLLDNDTHINIIRLNEVPYVELTLWWLDKLGIKYSHNNFNDFTIPGRQSYKGFDCTIPGDFSSATFFMVLAAISGQKFELKNLDMSDPQGDKQVLSILEQMGAQVSKTKDSICIKGNGLKGIDIDMNAIPDALPAMAVAGCFAEGETRLLNVPQARLKETDRIHVMCTELKKMGADIEELEDGLVIRQSKLLGCSVKGHDDHRIVMSLAIAGLCSKGETTIDTAEAMNVTFPEFKDIVASCGGDISLVSE